MEKWEFDKDDLDEFMQYLSKGGILTIIGCTTKLRTTDSLSNAYLSLRDDFTQNDPISIVENIEKNFFFNLDQKGIDKAKWTLFISGEGIFNKVFSLPTFAPLAHKNLNSILDSFCKKSKEYPRTFFFMNFITSKMKNYDHNIKIKIEERVKSYAKFCGLEREEIIKFADNKIENQYILQNHDNLTNVKFCADLKNKTYVFLNGTIISTYRKRVLGVADFPKYKCDELIKCFHHGIIGKEQNRFKRFFSIFALEICADNGYKILNLDHALKKPIIHVVQSHYLDVNTSPIPNGLFIKIDTFSDKTDLRRIAQNPIKPQEENFGNFHFCTWENISIA